MPVSLYQEIDDVRCLLPIRRLKIIACYREGVNRILFCSWRLPVSSEHIDSDAVVQKLEAGMPIKIAANTGLSVPLFRG
jgi:hypothetical protein